MATAADGCSVAELPSRRSGQRAPKATTPKIARTIAAVSTLSAQLPVKSRKARDGTGDDALDGGHGAGVATERFPPEPQEDEEEPPEEGPVEPDHAEPVVAESFSPEVEPGEDHRAAGDEAREPAEPGAVEVEEQVHRHVQVGEAEEVEARRAEDRVLVTTGREDEIGRRHDLQDSDKEIQWTGRFPVDPTQEHHAVQKENRADIQKPYIPHGQLLQLPRRASEKARSTTRWSFALCLAASPNWLVSGAREPLESGIWRCHRRSPGRMSRRQGRDHVGLCPALLGLVDQGHAIGRCPSQHWS